MKTFKFIISLIITLGLGYALSIKLGSAPPLGNFLSPSVGFWQNGEPYISEFNKHLDIKGLTANVSVTYDESMFPHIFAENNHDLYFAQGYITAKDRLWQMEFQTHAAAGRLSEIVGDKALDYDKTARRKGMVFASENTIKAMQKEPVIMEAANAYRDGINTYINSLSQADLPFEYKLLGYRPEPWTVLKTALLLKYMANDLSFGEKDLQNTNALALLGRETFDLLYPDIDTPLDPIVNKPGEWNFDPIRKPTDSVASQKVVGLITNQLVEEPNIYNGSNNWAVAGSKTTSGNPILCSDPHLGLSLPSLWYTIQLSAPGVNVMGASLPGSPNVIIGFTDSIAWGVTNAQRDLVDWYKITFKDDSHNEYKLDGAWEKTEKKIEEIKIAGGETVYDTVLYTHFGPVMFDDSFHPSSEKKYYALRWIAHDPSLEAYAFYKLNRAKNHSDYMAALDYYSAPAQNFAFASVQGDIAMRVQGKYPNKRFEEGKFLLDGSTTEHDWAFIPFEHNVVDLNPERGFIASANQYPADTTYPYYITARSYESYRNRRINNRLRAMDSIIIEDLMRLQNDNYNLKAAESLPYFIGVVDTLELSNQEKEALAILKKWNFYNEIDSKGASYYEAWWDTLYRLSWDELMDSKVAMGYPTAYNTIKLLKENPYFELFDLESSPTKESGNDIITKSFKDMAVVMNERKQDSTISLSWQDYKQTYIKHLLRLKPFGTYNIPIGGNHNIVNATSENHGPSWRMVVDLDPKGVKAYGVYPGGQSGNPGSTRYDNMIDDWAAGTYFDLHLMDSPNAKPDQTLFTQTLAPKN
ncbi:putative penicillin acylase [hydrothermal vent metagenome]|uniref:Putative penicillin acylase n=1 Tax=hydrothermal vent metagenome TaxID=652676 RepID=A0A3B0UEW7_9ZZZZ